jgi:hypothetical protein
VRLNVPSLLKFPLASWMEIWFPFSCTFLAFRRLLLKSSSEISVQWPVLSQI